MKQNTFRKTRLLFILSLVLMLFAPSFAHAAQSNNVHDEWKYVALGDSLAAGVQPDNTLGVSYADYIAEDLENIYQLESFTKKFAVPGFTTDNLLEQLTTNVEAQQAVASADLITLTIGANDFLNVLKNSPEDLEDKKKVEELFAKVLKNYGHIMGIIRTLNPDANVFLQGYYNPFYAYPPEEQAVFTELMQSLNKLIQGVALGSGSGFVPTYDAIAMDYTKYLPNPTNVHPGPAGYKVIANEFWKQIKVTVPVEVDRISGKDRYETAVAISEMGWDSADTVIIARGDDFPDALAGAPLAYKMDAPILLTGKTLPQSVKDEIARLHATKAIILGGEGAVLPYVYNELKSLGLDVDRIGGADRFDTATNIAAVLDGDPAKAVVANGMNFPDALSIASFAAENGYPILLTKKNELPESTKKALGGFESSIAVGGTGVITDSVLGNLPGGERYGGENRYATSAMVARMLNPADKAFIATGADFADALTGSVLAAKTDSTFLLVPPTSVNDSISGAATELGIRHFTILGGEGAVNSNVESLLESIK
ncbi:cell wall-binding repeat-containing protein [Guptibacillus algicola]|uniref:cell wall-binding repeat-containing protein n=1 Tax=Guptibacillus algicola TaxID=225844 RepID=UPI001CD5CE04|nr:cell wall-binding repeat-containing protein [Alkalihalobacillus algicola]MCA0987100.1 cell wall-binding repeat-containing protein [Alkalihalobacillus algicola]